MAKRKPHRDTEHAEEVRVGGKRFRGAGAPTPSLKRGPERVNGYEVPREIIMTPKPLSSQPLREDPYHLDG